MKFSVRNVLVFGALGALSGAAALAAGAKAATAPNDVVVLDDIVLTASGFAQQIADAPATVTVIDGEAIASKPYASVAEVMRDVPGVIVSAPSARSGSESISIRGLGEDYVLMLVDGRPIGNSREATYNGYGPGVAMSYLPPPSAIERIEVIRGPMSSLYGSAASGGVINIITKPVPDSWSGSMTLGSTSYKRADAGASHEGRFYLGGPAAKQLGLSLFGSLHHRDKDDFVVAGRGGLSHQAQVTERKSLGGRLNWALTEAQNLELEVVAAEHATTTTYEDRRKGGITADRMNYSLRHDLDWGADSKTTSYIAYEDVDFENQGIASGYRMLNLNSKTNMVVGRHELTFGFDYRDEETRHDPNRVNVNPIMTRWQWALFAEDNIRITDDVTLTVGGRYDRNERYGGKITPRAYVVWRPSEALTVKGGISGGYKTPTLKQSDSNIEEPSGGDGIARDRGNTNLRPEESTNYEIGVAWEGENGLQLGLTAYHTRFKNKIVLERICDPATGGQCGPYKWINQYQNRDAAELNGIEATLRHAIGNVELSLNYTYADSKVTKGKHAGSRFNENPRHVVNIGADWQATDALSVWGNAQYRSATFDSGNALIKEHAIFNVGLDYDMNERVTGSLAVYNLGDKTFGLTNYDDGRRAYVGLTGRF